MLSFAQNQNNTFIKGMMGAVKIRLKNDTYSIDINDENLFEYEEVKDSIVEFIDGGKPQAILCF